MTIEQIEKDNKLFERAIEYRTALIESLANYDETLADLYLSGTPVEEIKQEIIDEAIRTAIKSQKSVALFCGSALKNKGI